MTTTIQKTLSVKEVFTNAERHWQSFAYDKNGRAYLHDRPVKDMICHREGWTNKNNEGHWLYVGDVEDASDWQDSAVSRDDSKKKKTICFSGKRNGKSTIFKGVDTRHLYIPPAKQDNLKTWIDLFEPKAQHQTEQLNKEILALKSLVNVQDEQLKEFEAKEAKLTNILDEVLQTLYAVDAEARVSLSAGQLLQLIDKTNEDDLPFF